MTDTETMDIEQVKDAARENAKEKDRFAVVCSDGDFEFARTRDGTMQVLAEFRDMREYLDPDNDYEYDVVVIGADYEHAGLWSCTACDGEFIVESKADVLGHACGDVDGDTLGEKFADAIVDGLEERDHDAE